MWNLKNKQTKENANRFKIEQHGGPQAGVRGEDGGQVKGIKRPKFSIIK